MVVKILQVIPKPEDKPARRKYFLSLIFSCLILKSRQNVKKAKKVATACSMKTKAYGNISVPKPAIKDKSNLWFLLLVKYLDILYNTTINNVEMNEDVNIVTKII